MEQPKQIPAYEKNGMRYQPELVEDNLSYVQVESRINHLGSEDALASVEMLNKIAGIKPNETRIVEGSDYRYVAVTKKTAINYTAESGTFENA